MHRPIHLECLFEIIHFKELLIKSKRLFKRKNNSFGILHPFPQGHIILNMDGLNIRKIFGENVKYHRKRMGLSQEQLAERLEISTNHLSVIETGTKFVTYKLLERLVAELQVLPATLFYSPLVAQRDESTANKINGIIAEELSQVGERIQMRLRELL